MKKAFVLLLAFLLIACATTKSTITEKTHPEVEKPVDQSAIIIPAPTVIDTPTKADIEDRLLDSRMIQNVKIGSPASLREAVSFIAADPKGLTDTNRLYLVITAEIMKRLYPHEKITWNVPTYQAENKYLTAFAQLDKNIEPTNLDKSTFLATIIPCFLALSPKLTEADVFVLEERLKQAQAQVPVSVLPPFLLGKLYENNGQSSKAKAAYLRAFELDESCTQAGLNYARLLAKTGNSSEALTVMDKLVSLQNTTEYKLVLGETYIGMKKLTEASNIVVGILTASPENTDAVLLRTKILIAQSEYLKANALLDAFATQDKTNKDYLLLRADLVSSWSHSTGIALNLLTEAYNYYPNDFDVLLACSKICFETGQTIQGQTAENFIAQVTAKDPSNAEAAKLLVQNTIGNENWTVAVSKAEELAILNPSTENQQLLIGAYLGAGRISKALEKATALYQTADEADDITALYLEALHKSGKSTEMMQIINRKMPTAANTLKSILYYYEAMINSGEVKLGYLRSSLLADPRNTGALFAMYQYYYAVGDYRKAEYYLKQVIAVEPLNKRNVRLLQDLQTKF